MKALVTAAIAAAATVATPVAIEAQAAASPGNPTPAQIRRAVASAERSPNLWATVNICGTSRERGLIGIRGQMPALGFAAQLALAIRFSYYSASTHRFEPVPHLSKQVPLGATTSGTIQGGAAFGFSPPVRLEATVAFTWSRAGRVLGTVTRQTTGGHHDVKDSSPPGYSAATCALRL